MIKKIYRLNGDSGVLDKITAGLRCRELSQEFIYFGNGSKNYIDYVEYILRGENVDNTSLSLNPWKNILKKHFNGEEDVKYIYIGVACGDSTREIEFIKSLGKKNILYIGVDLSSEMIEASEHNLKNEKFDYILIQADIFNPDLLSQINLITNEKDIKSFMFFGGTFGNFRTTNITDLLGGYLKKGEKLYIDITVKGSSVEDDFNLYEYYSKKSSNSDKWINHIYSGFRYINFPTNDGKIVIHTSKDSQVGLFGIHHSLKFEKNIEFLLNNKTVIFSKGEEIKFFNIIYYEAEKLINFMRIHHFKFFDKDLNNGVLGQFIFEKE